MMKKAKELASEKGIIMARGITTAIATFDVELLSKSREGYYTHHGRRKKERRKGHVGKARAYCLHNDVTIVLHQGG